MCATISLCGCSHSSRESDIGAAAASAPALHTTGWGVAGGRVSVVVRNESTHLVRHARAVITARDAHGNSVATTSSSSASGCCGIAHLAPGASAGLFAELGVTVRRVARVSIRYVDVALAPPILQPAVAVADVSLQTGGAATIVALRMTLTGSATESVSGQALLTDARGRIVAVLSSRFSCLTPGAARPVRLRLDERVPAGTIVASVWTFPVPDGSC
jgi:hypothetical protein